MTSLAHQLKKLALPQNDPNLLTRKEVASLLFDLKDASTMDKSTFYALGCNGLEALLGIEPKFLEFQNTLFSPSSVTLERSIQSKEVNAKLDAGISLFLTRLSPYFLLRPAQKCMEWLIHRFHIQLYNVDSLLACVLPYHETKMFVRVVQLLNLNEPTNRWNWLQCLQKPGVPLAKGTLITHCHKDLGFLDFICSMVTTSVKAYPGASGSCSQLSVMFSFYASSVVLALDSVERVTDNIIAKLLPYIQKGLSSSLTDHKAATYMIVCQLAVKVVLSGGLVDTLALQLCKSLVREPLVLGREGLACLIVLLQHQREAAVGPKAYRRLSSMSSLVDTLQSMAAVHDVSPLLRYLVPHLVRDVVTATDETESESSSSSRMFECLVQAVPLTKDLDNTMARLLLDEYMAQGQRSAQSVPALNQRLQPLLRLFESKYSGAMDLVLSSYVSDSFNAEQKQLLHQFISIASTSCGKHQILGDSDTSLLLSLSHPLASVRTLAVEHLVNIMTSGQRDSLDEAFVTEVLLDRMKDDVPKVVAAALKALELYLDRLDPERTISCLLSVLQRTELSLAGEWLPVLQEAVRVLCDPRLGLGSPDVRLNLGWKLLPLLVITSSQPESPELQLALSVARSAVMTQHPLTQDWAKELPEVLKRSSERDFLGSANQRLVSTLTEKLASMDHISKRDALDNLAQVVEDQRPASGGPRARAAFLVLTQALLQGLGGAGLSDTLHLLTAQRLYSTLQRPLVELSALQDDTQASSEEDSPVSFSEGLAAYLQDATATKKVKVADEKYGAVLLCLLREFISSLSCHDKAFTAEVWWNPEKMDSNACCYLRLLCILFELLLRGSSSGGRTAPSFRHLMKFFFQVHLKEAASVFKFLCVLWGYGANQGDQLELRVSTILQTQALCVGRALLAAQPDSTLEELASVNSPVVHTLLGCLCSPTREVREAAVGCLQSLSQAAASPFQPIIERLLKNTEEIVADPSHLSQMLGAVSEECVSATLKGQQQQKRLAASMDQLIQSVQAHDCPSYSASTLLRTLDLVHGESVLAAMLPVLERLLEQSSPERPALLRDKAQLMCLVLGKFSEASAPLLARDPACLDLFFRALRTAAQPYHDVPSCQIQALEQITKPFFSALGDEKVQQRLLGLMFDLLTDSRTPAVSDTIGSVFKGIAVDGQLVANELTPPEKPKVTVTVLQTRRSTMLQRKAADSGDSPPQEGAVSWHRVTLILELLQHKKKLKRAQLLVPALFTLLSRSLEPCSSEQHSNTEYSRQLLLQCLLSVCTKVSPDGGPIAADVLPEDQFNVELVVQCVRVSAMPQTHHHALLLLGAGARMFPEKVLHNIMPIFTFMGAGIMRLDDAYSFQVINRTVQTVIPALLKAHEGASSTSESSSSSASSSMEAVATRVMHVFADALPHVPEHRRLPIMAELTATLGPARFLWVLLLLLFKQHATHATGTASDKDATLERDVELWISLCCEFSVSDQLTALVKVLHYLMQLPQDKDDAPVKGAAGRRGPSKKDAEESVEDLIFNPEVHSSKELRHFKFLSVSFMAQLLSSASFIEKVADDADNVVDESLQRLQQSLLEEILRYIHTVARCVEQNADKPTAKFWRALLTKAYDVLDKVNALLPTDTFIPVIRGLMGNELPSVRRKAMDLLNNKLQHRMKWEEPQVTVLLQLTSDLLSIVGKGPGGAVTTAEEEEREDQAINRQTALYSLKLLCRNFGADHQEAFVPVLARAVALVASAGEERNVTGSALLCIAEVVSTLKARAIPQLPKLMPAVLQTLKDRKDIMSNEIYLLSAVTALQRLVETLPHFISPYLHKTTLQVCRLTHLAEATSSSSPLCVRLASLRATLATKVPPRVLLPTLTRCYSDLVGNKQGHLAPLMGVLKEHITQMEREELSANQSELTSFFLTALDFRAQHCQGDLDKTQEVEGNVIDCLVAMVMKLSEVTFRPLFFKLFDWSKAETCGKERLLTFYRLADCLAGRLKGLFVLFSGNLVKPFSDLLRQTNVAKTDEALFASEDEDGVKKTSMLLQYVLDCMFKVFLYDTQRFLSKERSETLLGPLVDQLENTLGGDDVFQNRVTNHLLPCIGQFAVAMGDDSQWKPLNYQILLKTRHDSAKVRFSSLLALMELTGKLRENYSVLLPETIPFLAELMEDESEEVEKQVQKVLQEMEAILGEPMQQYF